VQLVVKIDAVSHLCLHIILSWNPTPSTFLTMAYDLFRTGLIATDGNITSPVQKTNWRTGKSITALLGLEKMAKALGKDDDAAGWAAVLASTAPWFRKAWGICGSRMGCQNSIVAFMDSVAPEPYFDDEWADIQAQAFLLNDVTGHYPPNASYGAVLLAAPLNESTPDTGPWIAHTTYAVSLLMLHSLLRSLDYKDRPTIP
jgi:hypothetical protein